MFKKQVIQRIAVIIILAAIIGFAMLGCEGPVGPQGPAGNSAELEITPPTKLNYGSGACNTEPLDIAGLTIFIKIDDEFIYIIPETQYKLFWNGTEINNGNTAITSESGTKTITIIDIIGRKTTFEITVNSGHIFEYISTTASTCYDDGFDTYTCSVCLETQQRNIISAGHDVEYTSTTVPTCYDYGFDAYTCRVCSETLQQNIVNALGHDYGNWSIPVITSLTSPVSVLPAVCAHDPIHTIEGVTGTSLDDFLAKLPENTPDTPYHFVVNITGLTGSRSTIGTLGNALYNNRTKFISLDLSGSTFSGNQIDEGAFSYCTSLTSITIPNSVTSIGYGVFSACSGLTSFTIPNSVTSIGNYAFISCSGLTSITIPNSVTSIGGNAFYGCNSLNSVTFQGTIPAVTFSDFPFPFPGNLRAVFYSTNADNGTPGTYTAVRTPDDYIEWTRQP